MYEESLVRRNNYNFGKKCRVIIANLLEVLAIRSTVTKIDLTKGSTISCVALDICNVVWRNQPFGARLMLTTVHVIGRRFPVEIA